jgi:hypothetical protein
MEGLRCFLIGHYCISIAGTIRKKRNSQSRVTRARPAKSVERKSRAEAQISHFPTTGKINMFRNRGLMGSRRAEEAVVPTDRPVWRMTKDRVSHLRAMDLTGFANNALVDYMGP